MTHLHDQILPEGTQIGVYEIKGVSKISPFDITYRAWNHHLKERIKIQEYFPHDFALRTSNGFGVEPKSASDKENFDYGLKAFLHQAEMLTQIEHSNIAAAENILSFNGTAYLIMGIQEGTSLFKLIQSQASFAETELKFILISILNALQKIHEDNFVHGGIQPASILLGKDGEPVLINFAAARLAIAARTPQFADELATGYAPAEQYEPANKPGPATDFYALGATLYACMTQRQPVAAQRRVLALNQGEPDPMVVPAGFPDTPYSSEWLQAVRWMLQPDYKDRPQSANQILTLLKSETIDDKAESLTSEQVTTAVGTSNPMAKKVLWIGGMAGIVALVTFGLWFDEEPAELMDDKVAMQPLFQRNPAKTTGASETKTDQSITQSDQKTDSDILSEIAHEKLNETGKGSGESASVLASLTVIQSEPNDNVTAEAESGRDSQLMITDQSLLQAKQPRLSEKSIDTKSVKKHLVAAEKAMKAGRFTTPLKDNAHKYYQRVLAMDPDNTEAHAGLQRIVDRYVQFIEKAKMEGKRNMIKLYLQRAEAVLPDDPKLQRIHAELAAAE